LGGRGNSKIFGVPGGGVLWGFRRSLFLVVADVDVVSFVAGVVFSASCEAQGLVEVWDAIVQVRATDGAVPELDHWPPCHQFLMVDGWRVDYVERWEKIGIGTWIRSFDGFAL